jgi:hypothetical protein
MNVQADRGIGTVFGHNFQGMILYHSPKFMQEGKKILKEILLTIMC